MNIRRQSDVAFDEVGRVNIWLGGGKRPTIWWARSFARTKNPKTDQIAKDHCRFLSLAESAFASTALTWAPMPSSTHVSIIKDWIEWLRSTPNTGSVKERKKKA